MIESPSAPAPLVLDVALRAVAERLGELARGLAPGAEPEVRFEAPRRREFGDFATNVAFGLAKAARTAPAALATRLAELAAGDAALAADVETIEAAAGFLNLRLSAALWRRVLAEALDAGEAYGRGRLSGAEAVSLEFGSANPTGPLVVVQGRTLSVGDTLARALRFCGVPTTTEWLINDAGSQLETFGASIYARYRQATEPDFPFPEGGYPGAYVTTVAERLRAADGARWETAPEAERLAYVSRFGRDAMVEDHRRVAAAFRVGFDRWQSERDLHEDGSVARGVESLRARGLTYEADGALWFRATAFGDDKDRVLRRSDGRPTYYAGDVAYHDAKYARGAARAIDVLGPDHHGYIGRLKALVAALGRDPGSLEVLIAQQMTLVRGDEVVKMSKRAGQLVTLEEVIDEVGVDAARFFFILSGTDSPLTFDLELAKRTGDENPVHYVRYAHARVRAVERKAPPEALAAARDGASLEPLGAPSERALIARLAELPDLVAGVARHRAPHRLAKYARDVATDFHRFYAEERIVTDDAALTAARLRLAIATRTALRVVLGLAGVEAPETM